MNECNHDLHLRIVGEVAARLRADGQRVDGVLIAIRHGDHMHIAQQMPEGGDREFYQILTEMLGLGLPPVLSHAAQD